jgi:hypothetical protein
MPAKLELFKAKPGPKLVPSKQVRKPVRSIEIAAANAIVLVSVIVYITALALLAFQMVEICQSESKQMVERHRLNWL